MGRCWFWPSSPLAGRRRLALAVGRWEESRIRDIALPQSAPAVPPDEYQSGRHVHRSTGDARARLGHDSAESGEDAIAGWPRLRQEDHGQRHDRKIAPRTHNQGAPHHRGVPLWDGRGGIRTLETVAGLPVFETGSFNHSDTRPQPRNLRPPAPGDKGNCAPATLQHIPREVTLHLVTRSPITPGTHELRSCTRAAADPADGA